jgi:hypothetical protein
MQFALILRSRRWGGQNGASLALMGSASKIRLLEQRGTVWLHGSILSCGEPDLAERPVVPYKAYGCKVVLGRHRAAEIAKVGPRSARETAGDAGFTVTSTALSLIRRLV